MIYEERRFFHGDGIPMPSLQETNRSSGVPTPALPHRGLLGTKRSAVQVCRNKLLKLCGSNWEIIDG